MEQIKLDLIPGRVMPICHASQYDEGRVIRLNLTENDIDYTLDGTETLTLDVRKVDGCVCTEVITNIYSTKTYVDFETTQQMCACYGSNLCELKIESGTKVIGTLNFILEVERDPLDQGIVSQSEITDLASQVQKEVDDYIDDTFYNKTEVDNLLDGKADKSNTYTKAEVDAALGLKADASTVYTKAEVDTALAAKANISDVYTKDETDALVYAVYPTDTLNGALVDCNDGADNIPVKSWQTTIEPIQSGTGTPTPDNVRTISGRTSITVTRTGKNLLGGTKLLANAQAHLPNGTTDLVNKTFIYSAGYVPEPNTAFSQGIKFKENTRYTFIFTVLKTTGTGANIRIRFTDGNNINVSGATVGEKSTLLYTSPSNKTILDVRKYTGAGTTTLYYEESGIFEGVLTTDDFVAYNGVSKVIPIGQTVYGGNADITGGTVNSDVVLVNYDGSEDWATNGSTGVWLSVNGQGYQRVAYCNMFEPLANGTSASMGNNQIRLNQAGSNLLVKCPDAMTGDAFKTFLQSNPLQVAYRFASTEIDVSPENLNTLKGFNSFYSDCGDSTLEYRADIGLYIAKKLPAPSLGSSLGSVLQAQPLGSVLQSDLTPSETPNEED